MIEPRLIYLQDLEDKNDTIVDYDNDKIEKLDGEIIYDTDKIVKINKIKHTLTYPIEKVKTLVNLRRILRIYPELNNYFIFIDSSIVSDFNLYGYTKIMQIIKINPNNLKVRIVQKEVEYTPYEN